MNLYKVDFDPSRETTVGRPVPITQGSRVDVGPAVSPDGKWLTFNTLGKREDVYLVRTDGTGLRQLTDDEHVDRVPRWSPDGKRIAIHSDRSGKNEIWIIHPDGSGLVQLSHVPTGHVISPVWSPDGARIAGSVRNATPFVLELGKGEPPGKPQSLPALSEPNTWFTATDWSPDNKKLVGFRVPPDGVIGGIVTYSFDSRTYQRLTDSGSHPRWLRDSRRVLFGQGGKLYLVDSSRRVREILSMAPQEVYRASEISPYNRTIYFSLEAVEADVWLLETVGKPP